MACWNHLSSGKSGEGNLSISYQFNQAILNLKIHNIEGHHMHTRALYSFIDFWQLQKQQQPEWWAHSFRSSLTLLLLTHFTKFQMGGLSLLCSVPCPFVWRPLKVGWLLCLSLLLQWSAPPSSLPLSHYLLFSVSWWSPFSSPLQMTFCPTRQAGNPARTRHLASSMALFPASADRLSWTNVSCL